MKTYHSNLLSRNFVAVLLASTVVAPALAQETPPEITEELRGALITAVTSNATVDDGWDAQVWLTAKNSRLQQFIEDESERLALLHAVHEEASRAGLPTELVLAVIEVESRFDPYAISRAGAQGLMQVMSFWKEELGRPEDNLTDMRTNLRYGCTILAYYQQIEPADLDAALARYNGSYGQSWYPDRVMEALSRWR